MERPRRPDGHSPLDCFILAVMRALLVASAGGHVKQLSRLAPRLRGVTRRTWVTFDTAQTRSLLAGEDVLYVPYMAPRDVPALARNLRIARAFLRRERFELAVSTGSGVALAWLPSARAAGVDCHYVESAARSLGPSLTGRLLARFPGIRCYSQYRSWAGGAWSYAGSVFEGFEVAATDPRPVERVVVTVGTVDQYGFRRLIDAAHRVIPPGIDVLWQVGSTDVSDLGLAAHRHLASAQLDDAMRDAQVVITHSGIGSALSALEAGRRPILVAREKRYGEHVDDHQAQIAEVLDGSGLALRRSPGELTSGDLAAVAASEIRTASAPPPLMLDRPQPSA